MQKIIIGVALCVASCSDPLVASGPSDAQIREAYLATGDVLLGNDILSGELKLVEFRKIGCSSAGQNLFHCKFYAKFGFANASGDSKIIDHLIGSQSGYFREATFFRNAEGKWVCAEVSNSPSSARAQQAGGVGNE